MPHTSKGSASEPSGTGNRHAVHDEHTVLTSLMHSNIKALIITLIDDVKKPFMLPCFKVKHFHVNVLHHVEYWRACSAQEHTIHLPLGETA